MKYPKEYLEEIKTRLRVSVVVGKYVQLKKRGKEFIGLSPFKNEKTPSFTVNDEKGFYHCFSSGEHGNIFDFLMKTQSMGFGESVRTLASEAGMEQYRFTKFDKEKEEKFLIYKNILKDYKDYFHKELFKKENIEYINYLNSRNVKKNTIEEFNLGFVPWKNNFFETLKKNYSENDILKTGLFYKSDKTGEFIHRFNSRIIFPINNISSDTIAFGGRAVKSSKIAKYINSPETDFYKKGNIIFNLDKAKNERSKTKEVLIVEGYMDVISLSSNGIKNVVSNSGTAITEKQIELIWNFFSNPIITLDGDQSGQTAALRISERLIPLITEKNRIFFSVMPENVDPDDMVSKQGKEKFLEHIASKMVIQSFIWNSYSGKVDKNDPFAISKFEKKIRGLSNSIKDKVLKKYILEYFLSKINDFTPIQSRKKNYKKNYNLLSETKKLHNQKQSFSRQQLKEFSLLNIIIQFPELIDEYEEILSKLNLSSPILNEFKAVVIKDYFEKNYSKKSDFLSEENFKDLIEQIKSNTNITTIFAKKNLKEKQEILNEIIEELKEINQLQKIKILESEVVKNFDESKYNQLLELKNQLNRE